MTVKLILRDKDYEVKPGMTLLDSLKKINVLSESVIATREGEMILDDEILKDGDVVKLIAVISGGSCHCEERTTLAPHASAGVVSDEAISNFDERLLRRAEALLAMTG